MQPKFLLYPLTALLCIFALNGKSQNMLVDEFEQKPYVYSHIYKINKAKPVKSVTYFIKKYHKGNLTKIDTVYKELLKQDGNRLSYISFKTNSPSIISVYEYFPNRNYFQWETKEIGQKNNSNFTRVTKNKSGKDLLHYQASIKNGDTSNRVYIKFNYNADGLLVKKTNEINKTKSSFITYEYANKNMVLAKSYYNPNTPGFYQATAYKYANNNLAIEKKTYQVRNGIADTPALHHYYTYDNNLLVKEKYEGYNDKAKIIETTVDYTYNSNEQLTKLLTKKDTLFKEIDYQYENDKLKKITISSNTDKELLREEFIYVDSTIKKPLRYEMIFEYDQFGNLFNTKAFINGELHQELTKVFLYY